MAQPHHAKGSVFVALVHETLKGERFTSIADLSAAVKARASLLRLRYDADVITQAITHVERVIAPVPIVGPAFVVVPSCHDDPVVELTRDEATRILDELQQRTQTATARPRPMPRRGRAVDVAGLRALLQAIAMTDEHCDALEALDVEHAETGATP